MNQTQKATAAGLTALAVLMGGASAWAFHINAKADTILAADANGYVGGAISNVTRDLGAPSMVRNSLVAADQIVYIYIGESQVVAFEVKKEGKAVVAYRKDGRATWEKVIYPSGYKED